MNKNSEPKWKQQKGFFIETVSQRRKDICARIYSEEQRDTLQGLINQGYIPTETIVGRAKCTHKHWKLEPYSGKRGEGYRMITSYPWSSNFNSITYLIKQAA